MTTCCYGPLKEDLTFVRMLLISSKRNIIACVRERLPSTVHMASRGPYLETSPTTSYGQPRTGHRDVPHSLIWSATDYTTEHLSTVRKTAWVDSHREQVHHDGQVPETTPRTSSPRRHRRSHGPRRLHGSLNLLILELKYIGCAESQCKQTGLKPLKLDPFLYKRQPALHQLQSITVVVLSPSAEISAIT